VRLAVKVAYDGRMFEGSAYQVGRTTVLGELRKVFEDVKMAGRTDAGVSALGNVACFSTELSPLAAVMSINQRCRHIWAHAWAEVDEGFNPRHAEERWYRYLLPEEGHDLRAMEEAAAQFPGRHDFSMFSKKDVRRRSTRTLHSVEVAQDRGFVVIDVRGKSFLWKMVRYIASALAMVGKGELTPGEIGEMLQGRGRRIAPLPAEGLILMDVAYGFEFTPVEPALEMVRRHALRAEADLRWRMEYCRYLSGLG